MTVEEQYTIYTDYLLTQLRLIHEPLELDIHAHTDKYFSKIDKKYPILLPNSHFINSRFKKEGIVSFEKFISEKNTLKSESLEGWYWRFKHRINLDNIGKNKN